MRIGIISCETFERNLEPLIKDDPDIVHKEYLQFGFHEAPLVGKVECQIGSGQQQGSGVGSCLGPLVLNGSSASIVTIQGEIEDAKFLAKKGPNGTYSHF